MSSASNRTVNTCSYSDDGNHDGNAEIRQMRSAPKQRTSLVNQTALLGDGAIPE